MEINPIILSIPIYFLLIGIELVVQFVQKRKLYLLNDAFANIGCGITQQISGLLFKIMQVYHGRNPKYIDKPRWGLYYLGSPVWYVSARGREADLWCDAAGRNLESGMGKYQTLCVHGTADPGYAPMD